MKIISPGLHFFIPQWTYKGKHRTCALRTGAHIKVCKIHSMVGLNLTTLRLLSAKIDRVALING